MTGVVAERHGVTLTDTNLQLQPQSYRDTVTHARVTTTNPLLQARTYRYGPTAQTQTYRHRPTDTDLQTQTYRHGSRRGADESLFKAYSGLLGSNTNGIKRATDLLGTAATLLGTNIYLTQADRSCQKVIEATWNNNILTFNAHELLGRDSKLIGRNHNTLGICSEHAPNKPKQTEIRQLRAQTH